MSVTNIFSAQLESMLKKVRRLAASGRMDQAAYEAVRMQVSAEIMKDGRPDVVTAALGELNDAHAEHLLNEIITHCSETFYFPDRILKAIVVPVAVRVRANKEGELTLFEGREDDLATIATTIERKMGSRRVVFDNRLYPANNLYYARPRTMRDFLSKLEAGERQADGGPKSVTLNAQANSDWEMIYFLGVEILDPGAPACLNSEVAQRALYTFRSHAEWAIQESNQVLFNTRVNADAKCYGFHYVNEAVKIGEQQIRSDTCAYCMRMTISTTKYA